MKLRRGNTDQGGVLVVTIVISALVGLMLTAYLGMVSSQHSYTQRSQVWNNAIPMCEAGIEEAMAHINHINTTSNFAINGWRKDGVHYRKERYMNRGECRMEIDNNMPPIITVQGRLKEPIGDDSVIRSVRVRTKINFRFPNGILARGTVNLAGSGKIDSFNSTNDLESTDGKYDAAKATDRATVATVLRANGAINVGNMSIYGSVGTGPSGTVLLSPNGNVGSTAFNNNDAYNGRIEPGHITDDVNVYIPPAIFPTQYGPLIRTPTAGPYPLLPPNTNYTLVVSDGDWTINTINLSSSQTMIVTGKARLRVTGTTTIGGKASILIIPGASLELYVYSTTTLGGSGVINSSGVAKNFSIIGMTPAMITYNGSAGFIGTVYAPSAPVSLSGNSDAYGAIVANNFTLGGTMGLHYDEALKGDQREGRFLAASWQEIQL